MGYINGKEAVGRQSAWDILPHTPAPGQNYANHATVPRNPTRGIFIYIHGQESGGKLAL
jgi:hypothetical protein